MELIRGNGGSGSNENSLRVVPKRRSLDDSDTDNTSIRMSAFSLAYVMLTTFALGVFVGAAIALSSVNSRDKGNYNLNEIIKRYDLDGDEHLNSSEFEAYLKNR